MTKTKIIKKCSTKFCHKQRAAGRTICGTCAQKKWRLENPMKYTYINLKTNAKRRGKEFTISFEYFQEFAIETEYMAGKGRSRTSWTIDRIDPEKGYVEGNLQVMENHDNVRKHRMYLKETGNWGEYGHGFRTVKAQDEVSDGPTEDCPF